MKKRPNRIIQYILLSLLVLSLFGCQKKQEEEMIETLTVEDCDTLHEEEFGGVYIKVTIDDFNDLGFSYGDSVDVEFSTGYKLTDIPYYNGYYVDAGDPLLIGYPGYDFIKVTINYGDDLWEEAGLMAMNFEKKENLFQLAALDEHSKATISLNEKGKYLAIQEAMDIHYEDERNKFESDEEFANFRNIRMGNIREGIVYRSASPCDNQHNRAPYVDRLIEKAGVRYIVDLADNGVKLEKYIAADDFDSPYFLSLYEENNVMPLALNMNYTSEEFMVKVADGFIAMANNEGPYLIHCTEGKDRTGFVCMLLEALAGADYQAIADDYMLTYDNYYKINQVKDPSKYQTILEKNLDAMIKTVINDDGVDFKNTDLSIYARNYLNKAGMEDEQIDRLLEKLS